MVGVIAGPILGRVQKFLTIRLPRWADVLVPGPDTSPAARIGGGRFWGQPLIFGICEHWTGGSSLPRCNRTAGGRSVLLAPGLLPWMGGQGFGPVRLPGWMQQGVG